MILLSQQRHFTFLTVLKTPYRLGRNKINPLGIHITFSHVNFIILYRNISGTLLKRIFNLKNIFKPLYNSKNSLVNQAPEQLPNISKKTEVAISLLTILNTIFHPASPEILAIAKNNINKIMLYKTLLYLKKDPYYNIMLHKKIVSVMIPSKFTTITKGKAFEVFQTWAKIQGLKYDIPINGKTNFTVLYEIYAAYSFEQQHRQYVHKVTFMPENDKSPSAVEYEKLSLLFTKQSFCDLVVTYNSEYGLFHSLLDILIGRNQQFKGNLTFTKPTSYDMIRSHQIKIINEIQAFIEDNNYIEYRHLLVTLNRSLSDIKHSNLTEAAKVIAMQEKLINIIPLIRKVNSIYNPNMMVFIPENQPISSSFLNIAHRVENLISDTLGINTPNIEVNDILKKVVPVYLEYDKPNLELMSPSERAMVIDLIKKYAPHLLEKYQ